MKLTYLFVFLICVSMFGNTHLITAQSSSPNYKILIDINHNQKFYDDPSDAKINNSNRIERAKYMAGEFKKSVVSLDAGIGFIHKEIEPEQLQNCDVLFIHIPSSNYSSGEIKAITQYLQNGGSLFLVMDEDYWSTLEQTNVNDIIAPFDLQFGGLIQDSTSGGHTNAGAITSKSLKISYHGGRIVKGGTPFCYSDLSDEYFFGTYKNLDDGGKIIIMGDGMVSLFMTSWAGIDGYQCNEFMFDVFKWLLNIN